MPITGQQFIDNAYETGFWWIAGQLGASELQIAQVTGHTFAEVRDSNRHIAQLLAFPYHDTRGQVSPTMQQVRELHLNWLYDQGGNKALEHPITLNHFRLLTDPYLKHAHD